jgi:hypothetical protein
VCPCETPSLSWDFTWLHLEKCCLPHLGMICYIPGAIKGASIKLLDVNEVVIIIMILGEPQHPNF